MPWRLYQGPYSFCSFFASSWAPCGGMWEEVALSLPLILGPCSFLFHCSNSLFVVFRNWLRLLTQFLKHLVSEGSQDVHVHNALGKISLITITTQNTSWRFLHGTRNRLATIGFSGFYVKKTKPDRIETSRFEPVRFQFKFSSFSKFYFGYFFR
jgi:hypothetical protein